MTTFPAYPEPPRRNDATAYMHGIAVLIYILATDVEVYGLLCDDDLELALHASGYIVTAPDILPIAVDRLSLVRRAMMAVLAWRQTERVSAELTPVRARQQSKPNLGPMAPLSEVPKPRPPMPEKMEIAF